MLRVWDPCGRAGGHAALTCPRWKVQVVLRSVRPRESHADLRCDAADNDPLKDEYGMYLQLYKKKTGGKFPFCAVLLVVPS